MKPSQSIPNRYRVLHELPDVPGVECWLTKDTNTGKRVVIRDLPVEWYQSDLRTRLQSEAQLLAKIDCENYNALTSYDVDGCRLRAFYQYCEGEPLSEVIGQAPMSPLQVLELASDLLTAMVSIHERGCVHRDWRPSHIVVSRSGKAILAGYGPLWKADSSAQDSTVGLETVRYASPELAGIIKYDIGPASDLYSLGLVLYFALVGRPAFDAPTVGDVLIQQSTIALDENQFPSECAEPLVQVIARLTQKEPRERYQSAAAVLKDVHAIQEALSRGGNDLCLVIGRSDNRVDLIDPAFVGREMQLDSLLKSLGEVIAGRPQQLLMASPSGMGKSRLIQEFNRHATRKHSLVFQGNCIAQASQEPNMPWLQIVDQIAGFCRSNASQCERLKEAMFDYRAEVITAMPTLAEVFQWGGVRLSGPDELGQGRVVSAFGTLLSNLSANRTPIVICIDNCQWMDDQSIRVLKKVANNKAPHQLLLLSSHPTEEAETRLRESANLDKQLLLGPLSDESVQQLAESMAGVLPRDAIEVVQAYADGSPFMASAVLRGMVESNVLVSDGFRWSLNEDNLEHFRTAEDAADVLAGRLNNLPDEARLFMEAAAVIGTEFTVDAILELSNVDVNDAHRLLFDIRKQRMIWSRPDGSYAFVHDKIRNAVLSRLSDEVRQCMHGKFGVYLSRTSPEKAFDLAYHFDQANLHAEALPHAMIAAGRARESFSLGSARRQLEIAVRAFHVCNQVTRHRIESMMSEVLMLQGNYDDAETWLDACVQTAMSEHDEAFVATRRGELAFKRGNKDQAVKLFEYALSRLGETVCHSRLKLFVNLSYEIGRQTVHSLFPNLVKNRVAFPDETEQLCLKLFSHCAHAYWYTRDKYYTLWVHLRGMNRGELYQPTASLAQAYSEHAPAMSLLGWFKRGTQYAKQSLAIRKDLQDIWGQGQSRNFLSILYYSASQFDECYNESTQAVSILERTGDYWEVHIARYQLSAALYRMGNWNEAITHARRNYRSAIKRNDYQATGNIVDIWSRAGMGNIPVEVLESEINRDVYDPQRICQVKIAQGVYLYYQDQFADAVLAFSDAIRGAENVSVVNTYTSPAYPWLATALRGQLETSPPKTAAAKRKMLQQLTRAARRAVKISRRYANEAPHALREYAAACAIEGQSEKAESLFEESIAIAIQQGAKVERTQTIMLRATYATETGWHVDAGELREAQEAFAQIQAAVGSVADVSSLSLVDRFDSLLEAGRSIVTGTDPASIRKELIAAVSRLLRGDRALMVLSPHGKPSRVTLPADTPFDPKIVEQCEQSGGVIVCDQEEIETQSIRVSGTTKHESYGTFLCCPVMVRGKIESYLYVANSHMMGMYGEDEIRIATYLASAAGAALEKADGFQKLQELNQNLENKVAERTETLEARNQEISQTADRLQAAQDSLRNAKEAAEQANHAKSEFLARMSHEIRTPITAVLGFTELMLRGIVSDPQEQRRNLETIHGNGHHLLNLLNDILDLSKIEADKIEVEHISCVPVKVVGEVINSLSGKAAQKGIKLSLESDSGIPETITSDPTRLRQIVTNLVGNAIKFTEHGGVTVKMSSRIDPDTQLPNRICFAIEDTGIGMESGKLEQIFDPFTQADTSTTREYGGTGLGLAISKRLAEALGGDLSVTSTKGVGSTFLIEIEADTQADDRLLTRSEVIELAEGELQAQWRRVDLAGIRVLVVDDAITNRDLISRFLGDAGAIVSTAVNGQEALDVLFDEQGQLDESFADVILMDMQMPVMDGYTATAALSSAGLKTPIVAMTANSMVGDDNKCRRAGCCDYLSKPIDLDAMLEMVRTWSTRSVTTAMTSNATALPGLAKPPTSHPDSDADLSEDETHNIETTRQQKPAPRLPENWMRKYAVDLVSKVDAQMPAIRESFESGDISEVSRQIHWLKGSGGTVGLGELTELAKSCEKAVHDADLDALSEQMDRIEEHVAILLQQCD